MEETTQQEQHVPLQNRKTAREHLPEVVTVRNAKEYLGESLLIVFSVVLALLLTELFNKIHENNRAAEILEQLKQELVNNKRSEEIQYAYHLRVLANIDSALTHPAFAGQFITNGVLNLKPIAADGIIRADLNEVAWQIAKENIVLSRLDLDTYTLLTGIYNQQQRVTSVEDKIGGVLLSWESRKPENLQTTLLLMRDHYHAWAVDRAPALLARYKEAIDKLSHY